MEKKEGWLFQNSQRIKAKEQELRKRGITFDEAVASLAMHIVSQEDMAEFLKEMEEGEDKRNESIDFLEKGIDVLADYSKIWKSVALASGDFIKANKSKTTARAKRAADALHSKPGNSRDKKAAIRTIWATGKYSNRGLCAEQECAALGMSIDTARKALRNTPDNA